MIKLLLRFSLSLSLLIGTVYVTPIFAVSPGDIVITEIMYNPPESGIDSLEYIELYNTTSSSINLAGYIISDQDDYFFPSNLSIEAHGYIVIAKDSVALKRNFGYDNAYNLNFDGLRNAGGETITLTDNNDNIIDEVDFGTSSPWPTEPGGDGPSLVLCDVNSDNNEGSNWTISSSNTGVIINGKQLYGSPGSHDDACDVCLDSESTINPEVCSSYTSPSGDYYWDVTGTYEDIIPNYEGCDSIITINLTILENSFSTDTHQACYTYTWIDGNTYTESNTTATHILENAIGCDSIVTLDLTILETSSSTAVHEACESFIWIDGNNYTESNYTATHIIENTAGCDSIITLNLTINNNTQATYEHTACESYTWIDGNTYSESNNTATHIVENTAGCDSTITLNLTIYHNTQSIDEQASCEAYTWINGITYSESNNTASHIIDNAMGCDSIITLDLTILEDSESIDYHEECMSFTWIDGNTYTQNNNTAIHIIENAAGCDSTITLNLTIFENLESIDEIEACGSYTWRNGITYTSDNNTAIYTQQNVSGCDSIITLNLTILENSESTDIVESCDSYTWINGFTYSASNNTATHILENAAGCDSIITLDLTIGDNILPVVITQNIIVDLNEQGIVNITDEDINNGSYDNCGIAEMQLDKYQFNCNNIGNNTVTLSIIDNHNNVSTNTAIVTVRDLISPEITCPANQNLQVGENCQVVLPNYSNLLESSDNCSIQSIIQTPVAGTIFSIDQTGMHTINFVVNDGNGNSSNCDFVVNISDTEDFMIENASSSELTCYGDENASITIITSGASTLFYSIDGSDFTNTTGVFNGLGVGNYNIYVKNINGCIQEWPNVVTIEEANELVIDNVESTNITPCAGNDNASIEITVNEESGYYQYSINNGSSFSENPLFESLVAGEYHIVVRNQSNCEVAWNETIIITEPEAITLNQIDTQDINSCNGEETGEIHISAQGGSGNLQYSVDNGLNYESNNGDFLNLLAGTYQVLIKDANDCIYEHSEAIQITEPDLLVLANVQVNNVSQCNGNDNGKITITALGGSGELQYSIDDGTNYVSSGVFNNLTAGSYAVIIRDENFCEKEYENNPVIITEPSAMSISVSSSNISSCYGADEGSINIEANGGANDFTYSIDGGNNWNDNGNFNNLSSGTYEVIVKDAYDCTIAYSNNPIQITEPDAIVFESVNSSHVACFGGNEGSINIEAFGGTGSLLYSIDNGINYQTNSQFSNLEAASYSLFVKDANNCIHEYENNPVIITQNDEILIPSAEVNHVQCNGYLGSIHILANGGQGILWYSIDDGANYQESPNFTEVNAGDYLIKVKDGSDCEILFEDNPVVVEDAYASPVDITVNPENGPYCVNSGIYLQANADYAISYEWQPGGFSDQVIFVTSDSPQTINYEVTILNAFGCESTASVNIEYDICEQVWEADQTDLNILVTPNPNHGVFTLSLDQISEDIEISIIDFSGRMIIKETLLETSSEHLNKEFDIRDFENGVYILSIKNGESIIYKKIVKH